MDVDTLNRATQIQKQVEAHKRKANELNTDERYDCVQVVLKMKNRESSNGDKEIILKGSL